MLGLSVNNIFVNIKPNNNLKLFFEYFYKPLTKLDIFLKTNTLILEKTMKYLEKLYEPIYIDMNLQFTKKK